MWSVANVLMGRSINKKNVIQLVLMLYFFMCKHLNAFRVKWVEYQLYKQIEKHTIFLIFIITILPHTCIQWKSIK
jgi:hypothetical protein